MVRTNTKFDSEESTRTWASAAFVGVLIVVGLPLWWKTTEVYRVPLPFDEIASYRPESHALSTWLTVLADDLPTAELVVDGIQLAFKDSDVLHVEIITAVLTDTQMKSLADDEEPTLGMDISMENHVYLMQRRSQPDAVWVGAQRVIYFKDAEALETLIRVLESWVLAPGALAGARGPGGAGAAGAGAAGAGAAGVGAGAGAGAAGAGARRERLAPAAGYHVVLSVVPTDGMVFDAQAAAEDYLGAFTDELSYLHNFTLKSQWLHLMDFDFQGKEVKDGSAHGRHFAVRPERLSQLLTRVEERAATRAAARPAVNLVLYAVPCARGPVVIYDENDKPIPAPIPAFSSPKWGGVVLVSPPAAACGGGRGGGGPRSGGGGPKGVEWTPDVRLVMGAMIAQLRPLLGIADKEAIPGARLSPLRSAAARAWERDGAMRLRTLQHVADAEATLRSLAQLLDEISNIVITDEVGASIRSAARQLRLARLLMGGPGAPRAGGLRGAHEASREAYLQAEAAFSDPSLLALLYFPDDQKYAIYIPLFLPIMFPVVLSLRSLVRWRVGAQPKDKTD